MSGPVLKIKDELLRKIHAHGVETYPHECCGALLGRDGEDGRAVLDLLPLANRRNDSPRNRFEVTPDDVRLAEKTATEKQIEASGLGFTFLRPTIYMQQMLAYARSIAETGTFSAPMGAGEIEQFSTYLAHIPSRAILT